MYGNGYSLTIVLDHRSTATSLTWNWFLAQFYALNMSFIFPDNMNKIVNQCIESIGLGRYLLECTKICLRAGPFLCMYFRCLTYYFNGTLVSYGIRFLTKTWRLLPLWTRWINFMVCHDTSWYTFCIMINDRFREVSFGQYPLPNLEKLDNLSRQTRQPRKARQPRQPI